MSTRRLLGSVGLGLVVVLGSGLAALAQLPTYGLGRPPTAEEIRAWDITVGPDGKELPPGSGTAVLGKAVFAEKCAACHGETGTRPKFAGMRLLVRRGTQHADKQSKAIGSYWPYATTVWSYINRAQPFDSPGSLTADEVYAVTAYLLHLNGIVSETDVIDAKALLQVMMPNRNGFVPDPRPDVRKPSKTTRP